MCNGIYDFWKWCNTTIPTIFDNSMSYYEFLCKLCGELQKLANTLKNDHEQLNANTAKIAEIESTVKQLEQFVSDFESGKIGEGEIEAAVSSWLENNGQVLNEYISNGNKTNMLLNINQSNFLKKNGVYFKTSDNFKMKIWGSNTSDSRTNQRIGDVYLKKGKHYSMGICPKNGGDLTANGYQLYLVEVVFSSDSGFSSVQPPIVRCFSGKLEDFTVDHDLRARMYMNVGPDFSISENNAIEITPCVFDNDDLFVKKYAKNANELTDSFTNDGMRMPCASRAVLTRLAQTLISYATFNTAPDGRKFFQKANSNSKIFYEAPGKTIRTMFSPDCNPTFVNGKTDMVCSTTALALIYGIDYSNSANNHAGYNALDPTMCSDIDFYNLACLNYHYSAEIANLMWDKGYCFKPSDNFENIMPGDIIFFSSSGEDYQSDFMNIHHIAVVGGRLGDSEFFCMESSEMPMFRVRTIESLKNSSVLLAARIPYGNAECEHLIDLIPEGAPIRSFTGTGQTIGTITPSDGLKKDTIYTLVGKYESDSALNAEWIGVCPPGQQSMQLSLTYGATLKRPLFNGIFCLPIIPIDDMATVQVFRYKKSNAVLGEGRIKEIHLYKGLLPGWI